MKKIILTTLILFSLQSCSQKTETMLNQNQDITADNIVEEISKQIKHYPSEKIYKLSYLNEIAFFKLYVNDVLVYREFQFPQGGSAIDINNVINKSGIYKVSYQLFPIEKTEEYDENYSTLTEDTNMILTLKSYDKKKEEDRDVEYIKYEVPKIETKVTSDYSTYKFAGSGKTYYEGSFDINVDVPYDLNRPFEKAQDLRKMDKKELETKLLAKYKEVWNIYQNKEYDNIARLAYDNLKSSFISTYSDNEEIESAWYKILNMYKSSEVQMQPIENYTLEFFAEGKLVAFITKSKDNKFRGKNALWGKLVKNGNNSSFEIKNYFYIPQGETEFKVY